MRRRGRGVRVPATIAYEAARGLLLLEDLGATTLCDAVGKTRAKEAAGRYEAAVDVLLRMQHCSSDGELDPARTHNPDYDPEFVRLYDERFHFEAIFHDVQFFTGGIHASLDETAGLPEEIKKKTLLMHYGDAWRDHVRRVRREGFAGFAQEGRFYLF